MERYAWDLRTSDLPALWSTTRQWWRQHFRDPADIPPKPVDRHMLRDLTDAAFPVSTLLDPALVERAWVRSR